MQEKKALMREGRRRIEREGEKKKDLPKERGAQFSQATTSRQELPRFDTRDSQVDNTGC